MVFIEFLMIVMVILLIIILLKLKKKQEPQQIDTMTNHLLLKQLEKIEKEMDKKAKEDLERQDKMVKYVEENISTFTRTIHGTKRRGKVGESILKEMLSEPIKAGLIFTDLDTDSGKVEFSWDLKNGKYLPIDSKLPELEKIYADYDKTEDPNQQTKLKKLILKQIEDRKDEIKKYLNNHNTIDKCIIAIPDAISDMFPEINKDSVKTGVFVTGYTKVFLFACILSEYHLKSLETGEIGIYRDTISTLKNIFKEIEEKTNTINRGIIQISGANKSIQTELDKSMNKIGQLSVIKSNSTKKIK